MVGEGSAAGGDGETAAEQGSMRKAEEYMPVANIIRIMRRILPSQTKVADDAKETIQECVTEFISYITSEANARCHNECRKTITPEDVVAAMGALGFHAYVHPLTLFLHNYRAQDPHRRPMPATRGGGNGGGEGSSSGAEFGRYSHFK